MDKRKLTQHRMTRREYGTPIGQMVEQELLVAITAHYEMVTVDAYVVMPDHLHCILIVRAPIICHRNDKARLNEQKTRHPLAVPIPGEGRSHHRAFLQGYELRSAGPLPPEGQLVERTERIECPLVSPAQATNRVPAGSTSGNHEQNEKKT